MQLISCRTSSSSKTLIITTPTLSNNILVRKYSPCGWVWHPEDRLLTKTWFHYNHTRIWRGKVIRAHNQHESELMNHHTLFAESLCNKHLLIFRTLSKNPGACNPKAYSSVSSHSCCKSSAGTHFLFPKENSIYMNREMNLNYISSITFLMFLNFSPYSCTAYFYHPKITRVIESKL